MGKDKLRRFEAVKSFGNFFQPEAREEYEKKGKWREFFENDHPIVLELGCGKGEYTVGLAERYPERNFIGVDIKGNRMYIGAKEALEKGLKNVAFCRTKVDYINCSFGEDEVDEIWLTFSDPQPKKPRKRLTSPLFIDRYREILKPGGLIHLKTDSDLLFEFTVEEIKERGYDPELITWDLYAEIQEDLDDRTKEILHIRTHYEKLFTAKGFRIKYCKFRVH